MAATQDDGCKQCDKNDDNTPALDPSLDFFSDSFDPVKALYTPDLKPPVQNAKIYDNLAKYDSVSKQISAELRPRAPRDLPASSTEVFERKWLPHQLPVKSSRSDMIHKDIFTKMDEMEGPLRLLKDCLDNRLRIKVWTRHASGIRGFCTGFVVLFDKHFNMALEDVFEEWARPKRRKIQAKAEMEEVTTLKLKVYPPKITVISKDKKTEICQRHMNQVMLRGEHVVIIAVLDKLDSI